MKSIPALTRKHAADTHGSMENRYRPVYSVWRKRRLRPAHRWSPHLGRAAVAFAALLVVSPVFLALTGSLESLGQNILRGFQDDPPVIQVDDVTRPAPKANEPFTFGDSPDHPDRLFHPYFGDDVVKQPPSTAAARLIPPFRELLDLYKKRQGEDDNFTIRVYDKRDGKLLELYTLVEEKQIYEQTGEADWKVIDKLRREQTGRLVAKHELLGTPIEEISAKWGRRNQVHEARERDAPFIEYEVRLARYLDLSLLVTEIGTVETFNQDSLVSSVGARGRYQMMPYLLRQYDINHYQLATAYGNEVDVYEEWHPLLTMEPSFRLLRGYVNAVGHEVPGLSAYHTGPGNLFKVFQLFLTEQADLFSNRTTVVDAFVWALTDGYETVSSQTSFKGYSRGYVPSGYGALRAVEDLPVDTSRTLLAERVQLKPERTVYLSRLLGALEKSGVPLRWARGTASLSLYERFRRMNPHFDLPDGEGHDGVPPEGDVLLVDRADDEATVRFFLPLNAAATLARMGVDVIDEAALERFDHDIYAAPEDDARTLADLQYQDLVRDIGLFGFTEANRQKLDALADQFEALAAADPSPYRLTQRDIILAHQHLWRYKGWQALADATRAAKGATPLPVRPPQELERLPVRPPTPRSGR